MIPSKDTQLVISVAKLILDGRDPATGRSSVLVTLEHTVALILIILMDQNHTNAARMLNEGLVPGVEARIALYASRTKP